MSMSPGENIISIFRRQGMERAPVLFNLCPSQVEEFHRRYGSERSYNDVFEFPWRGLKGPEPSYPLDTPAGRDAARGDWSHIYQEGLKPGTTIDQWGVAHEPGSEAAMHMTKIVYPMKKYTSMEQFQAYPYPQYSPEPTPDMIDGARIIRERGLAVMGHMGMTIWEKAWGMRGMEELMMEMMSDDPMAEYHLDRITEQACYQATAYMKAGADIIHFGDDVGMQQSLMMSREMYRQWLWPRLKRVINAARVVKPHVIISYHSCGFITPLIPDLIEAGIDVLNPVQPECMDFKEIHDNFSDKLAFWGTLGTQTTLPFGSPGEVRETVLRNLEISGPEGGLLCTPTHIVEPEVPWENIEAYVQACRDYCG